MVSRNQSIDLRKSAHAAARKVREFRLTLVRARAHCLLIALSLLAVAAAQDSSEMRIRIAWGGGEHIAWKGEIKVDGGQFVNPRCLGNEPDAWTGFSVDGDTIRVDSRRPQSYQALDVTVRASIESNLSIQLTGSTATESPPPITVPLTQLRDELVNLPLDEAGNRMLVRRTPGDRLRVSMARDHLVFSPGEEWRLDVQPWMVRREGFEPTNLQARIVAARSDQSLWREEFRLARDESGRWQSTGLQVPIPDREGSYELVLRAATPRGISLLPTGKDAVLERRVQFVVIDPVLPATAVDEDNTNWVEAFEFDASQARWWDIPSPRQLSMSPMRLKGQGSARAARWGDRSASVLGPEQWQTYPLPILKVGVPHMIEVECLGSHSENSALQGLGISIVEPTANGSQRIQSLDVATDNTGKSRLIFWPQTRRAQILLTNLGAQDEVAYGQVRLFEGAGRLPPRGPRRADHGFRTVFAHIDDPQFYRSFSATLAMDSEANRELTDWITFQQGGNRLVDYLRHSGMSGASLSCVADGGSLAPLQSVQGIPRHDTGVYLSGGQDVFPKDVLEMLMRLFDREDLKLQIGVQFATPLAQLEALRSSGNAIGIELTDDRGNSIRDASASSRAAYYNTLDPRVQQAMLGVIRELTTRYSRHKSFAGVRIDLAADSFTQLPGAEWGCDPQTLALFAREMAAELPPESLGGLTPDAVLSNPLRPLWIAWRQRRLTGFYAAIAAEVRRARPDAEVALHVTPLMESGPATATNLLGSSQTTLDQSLKTMGLDLASLEKVPGVTLRRPFTASPFATLTGQGKSLRFTRDALWQKLWQNTPKAGDTQKANGALPTVAVTTTTSRLSPAGLDLGKLFGTPTNELMLRPRVALDQKSYRWSLNQALVANDVGSISIGGDALVTDGNSAVADWLDVYQRLPAQPFRRFQASDEGGNPVSSGHPVSVGTLSIAGKTYLYAVNESAWPVDTSIRVAAAEDCRIMRLGPSASVSQWQNLAELQRNPKGQDAAVAAGPAKPQVDATSGWRWNTRLEPYQLVAQVLTDPTAVVERVESKIQREVVPGLKQKLVAATTRLNAMKQSIPYDVLSNASFDEVPPAVEIPGWQWPREPQVNVVRDTVVRNQGGASLRVESAGPVAWVRSQALPVPRSGRLALQAMVRFEAAPATATTRAPFRLAIEGTVQGRPYYRFAEITPPPVTDLVSRPGVPQATTSPEPPSDNPRLSPVADSANPSWAPFMLQVNDLPVEDLEQVQVRFDLMGAGRVWVDDVRLFDLSLTADEQLEVSKVIALADFQLRSGRPADCAATLERYWPLFLNEFVPVAAPEPMSPINEARPQNRGTGRSFRPRTGLFKRWRGVLPR